MNNAAVQDGKRATYPAYKSSGVEWLGEIPGHWKIFPLKRITSVPITDGPHETPELLDGGIPFISAEAIKNDKINFAKMRGFISPNDHAKFSRKYKPRRGDIYLIKSGATTGNVAFVDTDNEFNIWSPLAAIRPDVKKAITPFVFFFMKSKNFFQSIELGWSYGTQQNIGMNVIENIPIALPPLTEQRAIAAFLDRETARIDALIEKKQRQIDLLQEKRSALISHAVTKGLDPNAPMKDSGVEWLGEVPKHWEVSSLKRYLRVKSGDMISASDFVDEGYQVFGGNGFRGFMNKWNTEPNTIIIGRYGALCGNVRIAERRIWATEHAFRVLPLVSFDTIFFAHLLDVLDLNRFSARTAQPGLNSDIVRNNIVGVPPTNEQEAIAEFLQCETTRIDALAKKVEKSITMLREYRTALISAAVTGEIDVREGI
jgi:type I restriction enzyme S subunit